MDYYIKVEPTVKIYLEDINPASRKTILFLHGWPLNHKAYEYQYNVLAARGYRCIGMDTRGFGRSDRPAEGYSYNRLADDVKRIIEELNLMDITLLGHSMGGAIATRYMSRHNGFGVSRLVLLGAAVPSVTMLPEFPYVLRKQQ